MSANFKQRSLLSLVLVMTLSIAIVPSVADTSDELEDTQDRLDQVQQKLDSDLQTAGGLTDRIDALNGYLMEIQVELNELHSSMALIASRVHSAKARIAETQERIDKVEGTAMAQAVRLYKTGSMEELDALLSATSVADLDARMLMAGIAAEENTSALIRYGRLRATIREQNEVLFAEKRALETRVAYRDRASAELEQKRALVAADLEKIHGKIVEEKDTQAKLADAAARLKQELQGPSVASFTASVSTATSAGFIWPVNGIITSSYGPRGGGFHPGLDIDCYTGQPIAASKAGTVISASYSGGYGNLVVIDHGGGYATAYAHLSGFSTSAGASVSQGQTIGLCGSTGYSTGDHLHFEVRINGATQDPLNYLP
ncbi:MAG: peptidoglycan DD-metalloendopeptidase family protein [Actinobacteria bacterium]|nr:peptidoglycan DD-metalloendopeptidase family protein [Actinomycetota bacterium]